MPYHAILSNSKTLALSMHVVSPASDRGNDQLVCSGILQQDPRSRISEGLRNISDDFFEKCLEIEQAADLERNPLGARSVP